MSVAIRICFQWPTYMSFVTVDYDVESRVVIFPLAKCPTQLRRFPRIAGDEDFSPVWSKEMFDLPTGML